MKLLIGNLTPEVQVADLQAFLASAGTVTSCTLNTNKITNRCKGSANAEMPDADAANAIATLNGAVFQDRPLFVGPA